MKKSYPTLEGTLERPITNEEARQLAKATLSHKRYLHTCNVAQLAGQLATRYGVDPEKAALAGLLHDLVKEKPREELLQILRDNAIMAPNAQQRPAPVWHGLCASILARTRLGVQDEEVLCAIRCHTTGEPGMGTLAKILFLADMTSAERAYPEVEELRCLQQQDLDKAMATALAMSIQWLRASGKPIDPMTQAASEEMKTTC